MKNYRRRQPVQALQWFPPWHEMHVNIPEVSKGPRGDQGYAVLVGSRWQLLDDGDWIVFDQGKVFAAVCHSLFHEIYKEIK